ncbi:uncharacterized protein M6D78_004995 [Vipera latastei]
MEEGALHQEVMLENATNMASLGGDVKIEDSSQAVATPFLTAKNEDEEKMSEKERPEEKEELKKYSSFQCADIGSFLHNDDPQEKGACPGCGKIPRDELGLCDCVEKQSESREWSRRTLPLPFHQKIQEREKPYKRTGYAQRFGTSCSFASHKNIVKTEDPYKCLKFGENISQESHLNSRQRVHKGRIRHQCGNSFRSSTSLTSHQIIHSEEKYQFWEGRTKLTQSQEQNSWKKSPTGNDSCKCLECGKSFRSASHLTYHNRIHSGEKPYHCTVCGKSFTQNGNFNLHKRIHTGEKPHKCTECGKCFCTSSALTSHERIHTGEKPYECLECGKSFNRRGDEKIKDSSQALSTPFLTAKKEDVEKMSEKERPKEKEEQTSALSSTVMISKKKEHVQGEEKYSEMN